MAGIFAATVVAVVGFYGFMLWIFVVSYLESV